MTRISLAYYHDWLAWALCRAATVSADDWGRYLGDVLKPFRDLIEVFASIPLHGKGLMLVLGLLAWAKSNPDPLLGVRGTMHSVREWWA